MLKRIVLCLSIILFLAGCPKHNDNQIYLSDKYYNKGEFIEVTSSDIDNLKDETYILFTYNNFCSLPIPCDKIFESFMEKYDIDFLKIPFSEFKDTYLYEKVKYAPSIIIVDNGDIVAFLDAESDDDLEKYQDVKSFKKWLEEYIYLKK